MGNSTTLDLELLDTQTLHSFRSLLRAMESHLEPDSKVPDEAVARVDLVLDKRWAEIEAIKQGNPS
jgi:hypothetical protein